MPARRQMGTAVAIDGELNDRQPRTSRRREVLLVGELGVRQRAELVERGAVLTHVETTYDAFFQLAERDFDVVVVNPYTEGCGAEFVGALKNDMLSVIARCGLIGIGGMPASVRSPSDEMLEAGRARHRMTPFVVLPVDGGWAYAVVVAPPQASIFVDARERPLVTAIMTVNATQILGTAQAMA